MSQVTFNARHYADGFPLLSMERGGYQRRVHAVSGKVTWFFKLPIDVPVYAIPDAQVPTIDGKPMIDIGNWRLDKTVWFRTGEKLK